MSDGALRELDALRPGTPVEVRSSFDQRWKTGFRVESVERSGYHLRRASDGAVLPVVFGFDLVRRAPEGSGR